MFELFSTTNMYNTPQFSNPTLPIWTQEISPWTEASVQVPTRRRGVVLQEKYCPSSLGTRGGFWRSSQLEAVCRSHVSLVQTGCSKYETQAGHCPVSNGQCSLFNESHGLKPISIASFTGWRAGLSLGVNHLQCVFHQQPDNTMGQLWLNL